MTYPDTRSTAIRNLQRYLRRLSYETNEILPVPVDGIFDTRTEEALSEFQRAYGLPVTGRADRATWELLFLEYRRLTDEQDTVEKVDLFPKNPPNYEASIGEESAFVHLLQSLLFELSILYDTLPEFTLSGQFDESTAEAVREFQRVQGLPITGRVNRATWNRIATEYTNLAR